MIKKLTAALLSAMLCMGLMALAPFNQHNKETGSEENNQLVAEEPACPYVYDGHEDDF